MKEFRIFFGVLTVMLFVMCYAYHSRLMPILLMTVVVLCALSFFFALITRLCFTVAVKSGETVVRRKNSVFLKIRVKNNFVMPLSPIRIYVRVLEKGVYAPQKKMLITALPPFKEITLNVQNDVSFRGEYELGFEKVEFFDILKIFRFTVKHKSLWSLTSYPRELMLDSRKLLDENEEEPDVSLTMPYGFNKDAFAHLREYRVGEPLRHIHWKLSARMDNLIVKQMESNHDNSSLVFCDFCALYSAGSPLPIEAALDISDTVIETALAISRGILLSGGGNNSGIFFWFDSSTGGSEILEVADAKNYGVLARALAVLPAEPYKGEFAELLDEFADEIRLERAVYIITAAVNDDLVMKLRENGLISRSNVTLAVIPSVFHPLNDESKSLLEYLKNETKMRVFDEVMMIDDTLKPDDEEVVR